MFRRNEPSSIVSRSKQAGKAGSRVETGPAQPIDRAVAADQSGCLAVADQRIVFDAKCHCCSRAETSLLLASVYRKIERKDTLVIGGPLQHLAMPQRPSGIVVTGAPMFLHSGA
jgi:hypothetical protein